MILCNGRLLLVPLSCALGDVLLLLALPPMWLQHEGAQFMDLLYFVAV